MHELFSFEMTWLCLLRVKFKSQNLWNFKKLVYRLEKKLSFEKNGNYWSIFNNIRLLLYFVYYFLLESSPWVDSWISLLSFHFIRMSINEGSDSLTLVKLLRSCFFKYSFHDQKPILIKTIMEILNCE